ncbi:MAG TPA: hypothetical protein VN618_12480 [Solirubrobacteraceae bacterium]|nr:hypothetical protein [Solirubrobacteraceae bacterium]
MTRNLRHALTAVLAACGLAAPAAAQGAGTSKFDAVAGARLILQPPVDGGMVTTFAAIPNLTGEGGPGLAVGTFGSVPGRPAAGIVYVVPSTTRGGTATLGEPSLGGFEIVGARSYDAAGYEIAAAGDVNGDGRGDILLTAPRNGFVCASTGSGPCGNAPHYAYVVYGKANRETVDLAHLRRSQGFSIEGVPGEGSIAGLGHFDGSPFSAIAVTGARYADVIWGGRDAANVRLAHLGSRGFRITAAIGVGAGPTAFAPAGDVNGDGRIDLALHGWRLAAHRAPGAFVLFGRHYTGTVVLNRLTRAGRGLSIVGAGRAVAAGDVNGDGLGDLLVGRTGSATEYDIVYGSRRVHRLSLGALGAHGERILGSPAPSGYFLQPNALAGLGDLNRDGRTDVGIATEIFNHGATVSVGTVSVVYGSQRPRTISLGDLGTAGFELAAQAPPVSCPPLTPSENVLGRVLAATPGFSAPGLPEFALTAAGFGPLPSFGLCSLRAGELLLETLPSG